MSRLVTILLVTALALAGCSSGESPSKQTPVGTDEGCIKLRGIVVDDAIRPVAGALIEWPTLNLSATTNEAGTFEFPCIPDGTYLVRISHPLYATVQQTVTAGDDEPPLVKIQLTRVIFAEPYSQLQRLDGFLVCSVGFSLYASEECGEGVGVPCEVPQPFGCHRYGGQAGNRAQLDFWLDGPFVRTLVIEMQWSPTSPTLSEFQLNIGNDWTCDPFCNGNPLNVTGGPSPLYATVDFPRDLTDRAGTDVELTADTRFSTFVWPNWGSGDPQELNVAYNQPYDVFVLAFYYLPAPDGFSLLAGDEPPF